jgi:pimeloyl-ACP methyl ester carboxylesterase
MPFTTRRTAIALAGVLLVGSFATPAYAAPAPTVPAHVAAPAAADDPATVTIAKAAKTSARERRRVDSVRTPKLRWYKCYGWAQCATARLPLDYDHPHGRTIEVGVLRVKARNQKKKIGSLFVNPGGPSGSATMLALASPLFLSDALLDRFDIVGVDPRGVGASTNVKCFPTAGAQTRAISALDMTFPYGRKDEKKYLKAAKALGKACSTTGRSIAGAMSTAEVARDMDVMRRAVGDKKLTYLGFSYGTAIGQYYANMFPERFRAITVDGVINPVSWVGTRKTKNTIQDDRLRSADGAYKAFMEILKRCDKAGPTYCAFADGNPVTRFAAIAKRLKAKPLVLGKTVLGTVKVTYADFISDILSSLYTDTAADDVTMFAEGIDLLTGPLAPSLGAAQLTAARATVVERVRARRDAGRDFEYVNQVEAFSGVLCTDGQHPTNADRWPSLAAKSDKRAPYFGRPWAWSSAQCAGKTWTVQDEDAYRGPFNRRTAATVLVVGSYWDPATNYAEAVSSARLLPNSRLLSSDNWGHTAYGTGACATGTIDRYLLKGTLPAKGTVCRGVEQPFTLPLVTEDPADEPLIPVATKADVAALGLPAAGEPKILPPIAGRR